MSSLVQPSPATIQGEDWDRPQLYELTPYCVLWISSILSASLSCTLFYLLHEPGGTPL